MTGLHRKTIRNYSDATAERMDAKVRDIVDGVFERTVALLTANRALLDETAQRLLEKETLDETDLAEVQGKVQPARDKAV